jgi:hypothetical protein
MVDSVMPFSSFVRDAGRESDMVDYPWLFEQEGREYMLYDGNDYGRSGVGLTGWEPTD